MTTYLKILTILTNSQCKQDMFLIYTEILNKHTFDLIVTLNVGDLISILRVSITFCVLIYNIKHKYINL